jgi:ectoine hydroxylase-related dioxygenase (phytanoyl-CoA dioxygenase family)
LTRLQLQDYKRDGVLFPLAVLTDEEVARFRGNLEELEDFLVTPNSLQFRQLPLFFRWAYDLAAHPAVLDEVEQIIGPDILVHSSTMFTKNPGDGTYVSWHQDGHYWQLSESHLTSAWIALTDSNNENGCMRVVPGSNRNGRLPHGETSISERNLLNSGLEVAIEVDEREARDVVLRAGEMSLHHVDMIHGSNPNRSNARRIGFAVRYAAPGITQVIPHHEVILARGVDRHGHFRLLENPPDLCLADAVAAQAACIRRMAELRKPAGKR